MQTIVEQERNQATCLRLLQTWTSTPRTHASRSTLSLLQHSWKVGSSFLGSFADPRGQLTPLRLGSTVGGGGLRVHGVWVLEVPDFPTRQGHTLRFLTRALFILSPTVCTLVPAKHGCFAPRVCSSASAGERHWKGFHNLVRTHKG